jgi:transcriptional regulator of NAD metabolism
MNKNLLRLSRVVLTVVLVIVAVSSQLYAIDSSNRYFAYGVGRRSCEDYVKFREKRLETLEQQHQRFTKDELYEIVDKIVEHWIAGFLTAHNLYVSDTYDVAGKSNMDDLKARLEKSCRANSKQYFAEAVITLVQALHPQRVKADSGK